MVVQKRRKTRTRRGSRTCGFGRAHRGSGNKGGVGKASGGKKSDTKKRSFPADYFGKEGFEPHNSRATAAISIRDVDVRVESWLADKHASKQGDTFVIDLSALGYDKLIGGGTPRHKLKVTVRKASQGCADTLKAAGGELVVPA